MSEESSNNELTPPEKLLIDNPSDFQFHAAYLTYSEAYDKSADFETKKQLNQNISALSQNLMDYPTFYKNISQHRVDASHQPQHRKLIKTQRKREWRRKIQKRERNKRHKR